MTSPVVAHIRTPVFQLTLFPAARGGVCRAGEIFCKISAFFLGFSVENLPFVVYFIQKEYNH